ncbi:energy transducer TonB [uncultured Maribacter sp.]|uniref:energy transducer TonB n=1 Tax=uncultured Maribacter sp. TaxID=431308 RepID=UPI002610EBF2|nr:energy transducer TonB [uncultured Maribacter sp.]
MNKNASNTANSHGNENSGKSTSTSHRNGKHSVNLQKRGSTRFQFGLIIAMSLVYFALEASFENLKSKEVAQTDAIEEVLEFYPDTYIVEEKVPKEKLVTQKKIKDPVFKVVENDYDNDTGEEEFIDIPADDSSMDLKPGDIEFVKDPPVIEEMVFRLVEDAPIFPGCENVEQGERLACFTDKLQRHIQKNFRYPDAAKEMNIRGKVYVGFRIGKNGYISDIELRGPHKLLENEAARIIGKLPKMTPGKQRGVPVKVPFSIPINFQLN